MPDNIEGTWEEVFQRNEQEVRDLELRIVQSRYRELNLWKDIGHKRAELFTIGKGTAGSTERWNMWTPVQTFYGDSLEEVIAQAEQHYPMVRSWAPEFNDR